MHLGGGESSRTWTANFKLRRALSVLVAFSQSNILPRPLHGPVAIGLEILEQVQALKATSALESERVAQIPIHFFFFNSCQFGGVKALPYLSHWALGRSKFCSPIRTLGKSEWNSILKTAKWLTDSWETMSLWVGVWWIWFKNCFYFSELNFLIHNIYNSWHWVRVYYVPCTILNGLHGLLDRHTIQSSYGRCR